MLRFAPSEALCPDFWIARIPEPDRVIMAPAEIAEFNKEIIANLPETVYDLSLYPPFLPAKRLRHLLTEVRFFQRELYHSGRRLDPAYFEKLQQELNISGVREKNPVGYGFTVKRTDVRALPTADVVTAEPGDREFDLFQETAVDPAEPVLVLHSSASGEWCFVQIYNYRGWVPAVDIALAENREEWLSYQMAASSLVVTGSRLRLGCSPSSPGPPEMEFFMGARIPLADGESVPRVAESRPRWGSYAVRLPVRLRDGGLSFKTELIPQERDVSSGYLPYTRANIVRQAFKMQGERYGWGGSCKGRDCSGFVLDIFRSFGFRLPRNTGEQEGSFGKKISFLGKGTEERMRLLRELPAGSLLFLPGHVMLYLGEYKGAYYVIHAISACANPEKRHPGGVLERLPLNRIMVTDLSLRRVSDGKTLLESLTTAKRLER